MKKGDKEDELNNRELRVSPEFQKKMHRFSKNLMTIHALLSTFGAISYSVLIILWTNDWRDGVEAPGMPGWHISTGSLTNIILTNSLAVIVNINLCFAALLVIGFHKGHSGLVRGWCLGQFFVHVGVIVIIILSVVYDCKMAIMLSIPPFLYYALALSFARQIIATISLQNI